MLPLLLIDYFSLRHMLMPLMIIFISPFDADYAAATRHYFDAATMPLITPFLYAAIFL